VSIIVIHVYLILPVRGVLGMREGYWGCEAVEWVDCMVVPLVQGAGCRVQGAGCRV
jgi:hypothetical protein